MPSVPEGVVCRGPCSRNSMNQSLQTFCTYHFWMKTTMVMHPFTVACHRQENKIWWHNARFVTSLLDHLIRQLLRRAAMSQRLSSSCRAANLHAYYMSSSSRGKSQPPSVESHPNCGKSKLRICTRKIL